MSHFFSFHRVSYRVRMGFLIFGAVLLSMISVPAAAGCSVATWMQTLPDKPGDYCCSFNGLSGNEVKITVVEVGSVTECLTTARPYADAYMAEVEPACSYYGTEMLTGYPTEYVNGLAVDYGGAEFLYYCTGSYAPANGYWHMDPQWYGQKCQLVIKSPLPNTQKPFDQNDVTATNISYEADDPNSTSQINWTVTLDYATSGGRGVTQVGTAFTSPANGTTVQSYQSQGGRLTISATETTASGTISSCPNNYNAYVVGAPIAETEITTRLLSLYTHGVTPNLLTGIAMVESGYRQFANRTLYGYYADWPNESYDSGSHIGLMQMPTTMADAWDWHTNTTDGANLFNEKLAAAGRIERKIRKLYHGLPHLNGVALENMALVLYGPYASPDLNMQYYVPQAAGRKWQWIVNTAGNSGGVSYANSVRASVK